MKPNIKLWIATITLCACVITESILSALHLTTEIHYTWYEFLLSVATIIPSYYLAYLIGKKTTEKQQKNENTKQQQN